MKPPPIDVQPGESFVAYSERKDAEWLAKMRDGMEGKATVDECAEALCAAVDGSILARYERENP